MPSWIRANIFRLCLIGLSILALPGCDNSPYAPGLTRESIFFVSLPDDPRRLDPATSYRDDEVKILDVICPSYYAYQPLETERFHLVPLLGARDAQRASYTYLDGAGKIVTGERWSFQVRRDLRYQDDPCFPGGKGRAITATDFLYAFRRMADPANGSPVIGFFEDKIIGFKELIARNRQRQQRGEPADYDTPVKGLELDRNDPYTFYISLNQPYPQLKYIMAMHFTTPMPHEAVAYYGRDIQHHPVGCGAFMLQEWTPKRRIVLAKNPNRVVEYYPSSGEPGDAEAGYLTSAGRQLPLVDKVIFTTIPETVTGWNQFLQGYQDVWTLSRDDYTQAVSQQGLLTENMRRHGVSMRKASDLGVSYFAFNMSDPVVGGYTPEKRKLRQAISLAVNSQEYIELFSQGNGLPAQGVLPPGLFGYDALYRNPYRDFNPDLAKAKKLLSEAGYPDGIDRKTGDRLTIYYDNAKNDAGGRQFDALVCRQIRALGIDLESRPERDIAWQNKIDGDDWQFTDYGWVADYPDPENFFFLLYGPNHRPGPNLTGYDNPSYNQMFEKMRAMDDTPERQALILKLRTMIEEDCPLIFLEHPQRVSLYQNWMVPLKPNPISNDLLKYRSLDETGRAALQVEWNRPTLWPLALLGGVFILVNLPAIHAVRQRRRRRIVRRAPAGMDAG